MRYLFDIFIVEDDKAMRDGLATLLASNGYNTQTTDDFENIVNSVLAASPDLLLLDLGLPALDGQLICQELRHKSDIPIIILTSRDNSTDELLALNRGADDFIAKPYDPQILLAHISSILRRVYTNKTDDAGNAAKIAKGIAPLIHANVSLDTLRGEVSYQDKTAILTKNELRILALLMTRSGAIVTRAELQNELWQSDEFVDDNTLTVNVNRLRSTLISIGVDTDFIQTRRGIGYML